MNLSRRNFLKSSGLGFLAFGLPPSFLVRAAQAQQSAKNKTLVVVFQRGAMDGLNVVIPFKDPAYYRLRPSIAVREPAGEDDRAIDLDGFYGLHPALAPLKSIYDKGQLAFVQASGSPDNTRSHFDAQDYMEMHARWLAQSLYARKEKERHAVSRRRADGATTAHPGRRRAGIDLVVHRRISSAQRSIGQRAAKALRQ